MAFGFLKRFFRSSPAGAKRAAAGPVIPNRPVSASIASAALPLSFNSFEALVDSDDRTPISAVVLGPYNLLPYTRMAAPSVSLQRNRLSAIARYLYDNSGLVAYGVDMIANYSVPICPQAASDDPAWNKLAEQYFSQWKKRADYSGRFQFDTLQRLACKAIDLDGDIAFTATNEAGFVQLQTIESWRIGSKEPVPGYETIDGVLLDRAGRVTGYVVQQDSGPQIISANTMTLLYDPDRYHSYRGYTPVRRGSNDIRDHQDIKGFEKKATKISSALAGVIEGGPIEDDVWGNGTGSPDSPGSAPVGGLNPDGTTATPQQKQISMAELLGGDIPVLPAGQTLNLIDNKRPGTGVTDFLGELAGYYIAGLGLPPAFFLDAKLTGPNLRAVIGKAQRKFNQRQAMMECLVEWTWLRVIGEAVANGWLPSVPNWQRITFQRPPRLTIDLGDQMKNERDDVLAGQMSRQERFGNRGLDWQREEDQIFSEDAYVIEACATQSKQYGIPIETLLARHGFVGKSTLTATENPNGDNASNPENGNGPNTRPSNQ